MTKILPCCVNPPIFLIEYILGSKFYVCNSCIKSCCWSRGIKEKTTINNSSNKHISQKLEENETL